MHFAVKLIHFSFRSKTQNFSTPLPSHLKNILNIPSNLYNIPNKKFLIKKIKKITMKANITYDKTMGIYKNNNNVTCPIDSGL